ncbi:MAG TPA: J domain-containing protein [Nitrolancea sp.]|nr:J domain-containing protein [Nitrolancea sp.]
MPQTSSFDPSINYYEILDVPYTASKGEITRSYRRLMRSTHPDKFTEIGQRRKAEERAKLLNAAYAVLSRAEIRREYDTAVRGNAVNDILFQRYTGNVSGQQRMANYARRQMSPEMVRTQRRVHRSAVTYFLLFIVLFVITLILILVLGSLAAAAIHSLF